MRRHSPPAMLSLPAPFLPRMMGERQGNAVRQGALRHGLAGTEDDGALALEPERVGIERAELADQPALAMEIDGIAVARLQAIEADGRAAAGRLGEIAGLTPFQRFRQGADAWGLASRLEHQRTQGHQPCPQGGRAGLEDRGYVAIGKALHRPDPSTRSIVCAPRWNS